MYSADRTQDWTSFEHTEGKMSIDLWYGERFSRRGDIAMAPCLVCGVYTTCHKTEEGYLCMGGCYDKIGDVRCMKMSGAHSDECPCCDWFDRRENLYPANQRADIDKKGPRAKYQRSDE